MRRFIDRELYRIPGYLQPVDAMVLEAVLGLQAREGWQGALAEIGVFWGRLLALLGRAARPGESVLGIDLFDWPGQQAYVTEVLARYARGTVRLHAGSSLEPAAAAALAEAGPVRLFSIDGGHELAHVESDAALALAQLSPEGVIAFDDFLNPEFPDLSRGIIAFMAGHAARLAPLAISRAKLYACAPTVAPIYQEALAALAGRGGVSVPTVPFLGGEIPFLDQPIAARAMHQALAKRSMSRLGELLAKMIAR